MLKDFSLGTIIYVIISALFGHGFDVDYYVISLGFSILPDADFILYIILKKRLSIVTHRIIHYPIIFAIIGLAICALNPYLGLLFVTIIMGHFVLDSFSATEYPTGIRWLYPFSKKSWHIFRGKICQLTSAQQKEQLNQRKIAWDTNWKKRNLLWEIKVRMDKVNSTSVIFFILAATVLMIFLLGS